MIKVYKPQEPPEILLRESQKAVLDLLNGKKTGWKRIHKSVIEELRTIYNNKCAFCESILDNVNVSTYRPKSRYPWLTYDWNNLLLICPSCNSNKRDAFPVKNMVLQYEQGVYTKDDKINGKVDDREIHGSNYYNYVFQQNYTEDYKKMISHSSFFDLSSEHPLLLHPEIDNPEEHFYFNILGEIFSRTEKGQATIYICGLNRDALRKARLKKINDFLLSFKNLLINYENFTSQTNANPTEIIRLLFTDVFNSLLKSAQPEAEFSLLGRQMIENFDYFFTDRIESQSGKEILKTAYNTFVLKNENMGQSNGIQLVIHEHDVLIKQATENKFRTPDSVKQGLPCALKQIKIENYNGIIKSEITDLQVDTQWIFLTGENGFGKTSILQAIVLGLNGTKEKNIPLLSDENKVNKTMPVKIGVEIKHDNLNIINNIDSENFATFSFFAAFGPSRLNILKAYSEDKRTGKTYNIFNSDGILLNIENELADWQVNKSQKFNAVSTILIKLLKPYITEIKIEKKIVLYLEQDTKTNAFFTPKPFEQLASGFRSIIATVGDMLIRFDREKQDIIKPENLKGFVIIDEFDLHWHPKWQRVLVSRLSEIFKNIQFIVSTHSLSPLMGAPQNSVFVKVNKSFESGITMERIDIEPENLSPNILLSSPLFDTPILSIQNRNIDDFATDDDFIKWKAYEAVKEELKKREHKRKELFNLLNSTING